MQPAVSVNENSASCVCMPPRFAKSAAFEASCAAVNGAQHCPCATAALLRLDDDG